MLNPVEYLRQVSQEVHRVTWPSWEQTQRQTLVVIIVSLGIAVYIGTLDFVFQRLMTSLL